jgi:hypothetical protein
MEVPNVVATKTAFSVAAQLEMMNTDEVPPSTCRGVPDDNCRKSPGKGSGAHGNRVTEDNEGCRIYRSASSNLPDLKRPTCSQMLP